MDWSNLTRWYNLNSRKSCIKVFEPAWYNVMKLRKIAFEAVGEKLRTPMSIWKLIARYTEDAKNEEGLKVGIEKAAEETKIAFAREIKEMFNKGEYDKLVFLSFPYSIYSPFIT